MISYDSSVIREFAGRLYAKADWIVFWETLMGTFIGFVVGVAIGFVIPNRIPILLLGLPVPVPLLMILGSGLAGCIMGWFAGEHKSFMLRLQAQTALCQAQIEENTRAGTSRMRLTGRI